MRGAAWGVVIVAAAMCVYLISVNRDIPIEKAQQYARVELGLVARHLDIQESSLIGPIAVRKAGKEFYFTWAFRDRPDRPAIIVWVSRTGDTDAAIVDMAIINKTKGTKERN